MKTDAMMWVLVSALFLSSLQASAESTTGRNCTSSTECTDVLTECYKGICTCVEGFFRNGINCNGMGDLTPGFWPILHRVGVISFECVVKDDLAPAVEYWNVSIEEHISGTTRIVQVSQPKNNPSRLMAYAVTDVQITEYTIRVTSVVAVDGRIQHSPTAVATAWPYISFGAQCKEPKFCIGGWCSADGEYSCPPRTYPMSDYCKSVQGLHPSITGVDVTTTSSVWLRWNIEDIAWAALYWEVTWQREGSDVRQGINVTWMDANLQGLMPGSRYHVNVTFVGKLQTPVILSTVYSVTTAPQKPGPLRCQKVSTSTVWVSFTPVAQGQADFYRVLVRNSTWQTSLDHLVSPQVELPSNSDYHVTIYSIFNNISSEPVDFVFDPMLADTYPTCGDKLDRTTVSAGDDVTTGLPPGEGVTSLYPAYVVVLAAAVPSLAFLVLGAVFLHVVRVLSRQPRPADVTGSSGPSGVTSVPPPAAADGVSQGSDPSVGYVSLYSDSSIPSYLEINEI